MKKAQEKTVTAKPAKLTPFQKDVVAALEHIFTVEGWEIPDSAVEGNLTARVAELEARINQLHGATARRFDAIAAKKGRAK